MAIPSLQLLRPQTLELFLTPLQFSYLIHLPWVLPWECIQHLTLSESGSKWESDHVILLLKLCGGSHLAESEILSVLPMASKDLLMSWPRAPSWPPFLLSQPHCVLASHTSLLHLLPPHSCLGAFVLGFHCFENVPHPVILLWVILLKPTLEGLHSNVPHQRGLP